MSEPLPDIDISALNLDQPTRDLLGQLLNHIELLFTENQKLRAENQQLKEEIARIKGLDGKPDIKANRQQQSPVKDKTKPKSKQADSKQHPPRQQRIQIDREQIIKCERSQLPPDLMHRGYREVVIQNILFQTDSVLYRLERSTGCGFSKR